MWISGSERGENRVQSRPKTSPSAPRFCSFFSPSLSLPFQPPPAPPQVASLTTSRPPPRLKQPPFLPLSHFCRNLPLLPVNDSDHLSSQKRHQNHQLSLLITTETLASSEPLLHQPLFSVTISVACRT